MITRYVQYEQENENGCFVSVFEGDNSSCLELVDPDTSNDSEVIGEAIYKICVECELPRLLREEGHIEVAPDEICECSV